MTAQNSKLDPAVTQIVPTKTAAGHRGLQEIIVEEPIAIVFNGSAAAVMMATPSDLRDLAYGFAITEGYVDKLDDIESFETIRHDNGVEARLWVSEDRANAIAKRRRAMAGPVGCGLCGIESLDEAKRTLPQVIGRLALSPNEISAAMAEISQWQPLKQQTRSTHAAAFYVPGEGVVETREDVGRHNALDKLVGTLLTTGIDPSIGAVVMTSRISLELVQKCAMLGSATLIAASGPTSLAVQTAIDCGISLVGFCRGQDYEVFC